MANDIVLETRGLVKKFGDAVILNGIDFTDARTGHQSHSLPVDIDIIGSIDIIEGLTGIGDYSAPSELHEDGNLRRSLRLSLLQHLRSHHSQRPFGIGRRFRQTE